MKNHYPVELLPDEVVIFVFTLLTVRYVLTTINIFH